MKIPGPANVSERVSPASAVFSAPGGAGFSLPAGLQSRCGRSGQRHTMIRCDFQPGSVEKLQ